MKFVIVYEVKNEFGDKIMKYEYTKRPIISVKKIMEIAEFGVSIYPCDDNNIYSIPTLCFTDKWHIKKLNDNWQEIEFKKGIEQIKKAMEIGAIKKLK